VGLGPRVSRSDADPSKVSGDAQEVQQGFGGTNPPASPWDAPPEEPHQDQGCSSSSGMKARFSLVYH